jgi:hypothetical protein
MENNRLAVEREKIAASKQIADTKLQIARENKNKYDVKKRKIKSSVSYILQKTFTFLKIF